MANIYDEIIDEIYRLESDDISTDGYIVYVPVDRMPEIENLIESYSHQEVYKHGATVAGLDVAPDSFIDELQVLPKSAGDMQPSDAILTDPPASLITDLLNIESRRDTLRDITRYTDRFFFDIDREHIRLNHDKIQKYRLEAQVTQSELDSKPDELRRVKLGFQFTDELSLSGGIDNTFIEKQFIEGVRNHIHTVHRKPIYVTRERLIKMPYSILDIEHTERIRVGAKYTFYGGVYCYPIDTPAEKLDHPNNWNGGAVIQSSLKK